MVEPIVTLGLVLYGLVIVFVIICSIRQDNKIAKLEEEIEELKRVN